MVAPGRRRDHRGIPEPLDPTAAGFDRGTARSEPEGTAAGCPGPWWAPPDADGWDMAPPPWVPRRGAHWHDRHQRFHRGARRWGPCRRSTEDRLFGGVAGGLSKRTGIDPTLLRIAFVVVALAGGFGAAVYLVLWLVLPIEGTPGSIAARATRDRRGILLAISFLPLFVLTAVLGHDLDVGFLSSFAWPLFVSAAALVLIWRNCDADERTWLRHVANPIVQISAPTEHRWRALLMRCALGVLLLAGGTTILVLGHPSRAVLRPVGGALLVVAGFAVVFGPWWLRLARDLVAERQARLRAEDRADMAARVHDSVLQTLAMIQRSADRPQRVVQLARAQERQLRAWLFEGDLPGSVGRDATTLSAGVQAIAAEVEPAYGVPVDVVTVGDCPLDDRLRELLAAAQEATVNSAKWSGAPTVSLFAEVEAERVSIFVRDRGTGFDPGTVGEDRRGIAESILARVQRHGGTAEVRSSRGEGTEVELAMPLATVRR
jgi:signal transduction histidine kinase